MGTNEQIKTIIQLFELCNNSDQVFLKQLKIILQNHLKKSGRL